MRTPDRVLPLRGGGLPPGNHCNCQRKQKKKVEDILEEVRNQARVIPEIDAIDDLSVAQEEQIEKRRMAQPETWFGFFLDAQ